MKYTAQIKIETFNQAAADLKAKHLEEIGNNLDENALSILADKSKKAGMSDQVRAVKDMI
jgi:hypothetical protein